MTSSRTTFMTFYKYLNVRVEQGKPSFSLNFAYFCIPIAELL